MRALSAGRRIGGYLGAGEGRGQVARLHAVAPSTVDRRNLALLDRADPIAKQRLAIDNLLEVAPHLEFKAVAAQPCAHVELGSAGQQFRRRAGTAARGVEAIAQDRDAGGDARLLAAQLLGCAERGPMGLEIEQRRAAGFHSVL